jgi:hypothetical protein
VRIHVTSGTTGEPVAIGLTAATVYRTARGDALPPGIDTDVSTRSPTP